MAKFQHKIVQGEFTIESWYDRITRNWITQLFDKDGIQIVEAYYDYTKSGAEFSQRLYKRKIEKIQEENHNG